MKGIYVVKYDNEIERELIDFGFKAIFITNGMKNFIFLNFKDLTYRVWYEHSIPSLLISPDELKEVIRGAEDNWS